jgi:hypothetical protein
MREESKSIIKKRRIAKLEKDNEITIAEYAKERALKKLINAIRICKGPFPSELEPLIHEWKVAERAEDKARTI